MKQLKSPQASAWGVQHDTSSRRVRVEGFRLERHHSPFTCQSVRHIKRHKGRRERFRNFLHESFSRKRNRIKSLICKAVILTTLEINVQGDSEVRLTFWGTLNGDFKFKERCSSRVHNVGRTGSFYVLIYKFK